MGRGQKGVCVLLLAKLLVSYGGQGHSFGRLSATVDLQSSSSDCKLDPNLGRCLGDCAASSLSLSQKGTRGSRELYIPER